MKKFVRIIVLVFFVGVLAVHAVVAPNIEIGLDQKLSMPRDSHVLKYFQVLNPNYFISSIIVGLCVLYIFIFSTWTTCCPWDRQFILS